MPPTIQTGSHGEPVREAQYLLARRHYLEAPGVDGSSAQTPTRPYASSSRPKAWASMAS
jgi:hypothetical protein